MRIMNLWFVRFGIITLLPVKISKPKVSIKRSFTSNSMCIRDHSPQGISYHTQNKTPQVTAYGAQNIASQRREMTNSLQISFHSPKSSFKNIFLLLLNAVP